MWMFMQHDNDGEHSVCENLAGKLSALGGKNDGALCEGGRKLLKVGQTCSHCHKQAL